MTVLITDYPDVLADAANLAKLLESLLPNARVDIHIYESRQGLIAAAQNAQAILTTFVPLDEETLRALPRLKVVSIGATGCGNVSLETARALGIQVCALGEYCTQEVADHTMALLLSLARRLKRQDMQLASGVWNSASDSPPILLSSATLGIYGFGRIGKAVAQRALAFGMRVMTLNRQSARNSPLDGVELVFEDELLARSDIISNHMPQAPETERYFNTSLFARMEKRPIFLNLGRGISVDETALAEALDAGILSAAGLDVLIQEAALPPGHPLLNRDNVIITPHSAFLSAHSLQVLARQPALNLAACLEGRPADCKILMQ